MFPMVVGVCVYPVVEGVFISGGSVCVCVCPVVEGVCVSGGRGSVGVCEAGGSGCACVLGDSGGECGRRDRERARVNGGRRCVCRRTGGEGRARWAACHSRCHPSSTPNDAVVVAQD